MNKHFRTPVRQHGAALIIGLVLMTVLTLLAVSTMRSSMLELTMAGNMQYHEQAEQLAETGIADAIGRIREGPINPQPVSSWLANFTVAVQTPGDDDLGRYEVTIRYMNECGDPPSGTSLENSLVKANFFEIESTGKSAMRNAQSTLRQGIWIPAISCT
jgi:Tfp pilus assembly protein PilX